MRTLVVMCILLAGCDTGSVSYHAKKRICSEDQLKMVEREMEVCKSSGYVGHYCYDLAKVAHCSVSDPAKEGRHE